MIGFPLQLPIEASAPRSYRLEESTKEIFAQDGEVMHLGRSITLSIRLSEIEAVAVRYWLARRNKAHQPRVVVVGK